MTKEQSRQLLYRYHGVFPMRSFLSGILQLATVGSCYSKSIGKGLLGAENLCLTQNKLGKYLHKIYCIIRFPGQFQQKIIKFHYCDFSNSIKLGLLFRYYCIQFRFRAPMIPFLSFHFVYRHSILQDRHSFVEYPPPFPNRCNQIQSHQSALGFCTYCFFLVRLWATRFNI